MFKNLSENKTVKYIIISVTIVAAIALIAIFAPKGSGSIIINEESEYQKFGALLTAEYNIQNQLVLTVHNYDGKSHEYKILWMNPFDDDISKGTVMDQGIFADEVKCVYDTADVNLKYVLVSDKGKETTQASNIAWINNPGVYSTAADFTKVREFSLERIYSQTKVNSFLNMGEASSRNVVISDFFVKDTKNKKIKTISYRFAGADYYFNEEKVLELDSFVSDGTRRGDEITVGIVNDYNKDFKELYYNMLPDKNARYYAINTGNKEAYDELAAFVSFLSERYNGMIYNCGLISNWNVGFQINDSDTYNYMGEESMEDYVHEYARTYRICFNIIKNNIPGAEVFVSLDAFPGKSRNSCKYPSKEFIDCFAKEIEDEGPIAFAISY